MVFLRDFPLPFILLWMHLGQNFKMIMFEIFYEHLTKEQSNIVQLDVLSRYKNQSLVAQTSKGKHKTWRKQNIDPT